MPPRPDSPEFARWLFAQSCDFVAGTDTLERLPPMTLPEVAFVGRSNVGKSSLINALTGRKGLARASVTPGRTRQLNFFNLGDRLILVDLPGYGYAKAPKNEIAAWTKLMKAYLRGRANLRRVCVLIDSRHGLKEADLPMLTMLDEAAVNYAIVLTKADKSSKAEIEALREQLAPKLKKHPAALPIVFATSAEKMIGIEELRAELAGFAVIK